MNIDFVFFIKSVNKIAIIAFAITLFFIITEIYFLIRQKKKGTRPVIPEFKGSQSYTKLKIADLPKTSDKKNIFNKPSQRYLVILLGILFFLGFIYFLGIILKDNKTSSVPTANNQSSISVVSSSGIKLYNKSWQELTVSDILKLKTGDKFIIGISGIVDLPVDKARIRVNQQEWLPQNEVTLFNNKENVYYKEYEIATAAARLVIEAQLHTKAEGWLGQ